MLTFPRTSALVGALPRLSPIVADTTGLLSGGIAGKISKGIQRLQRRFPQLTIQVVMHGFPAEHPFTMHAFWLFNAGAFAGESKRGKDNHALLIAIDPYRQESAIIPGYGLEQLLKQEALNHLLEMSGPAFQSSKWQLGLEVMLEGLEQLLDTVSVVDDGIQYGENDY
jgi:uncharacterized membrane protein YgcG